MGSYNQHIGLPCKLEKFVFSCDIVRWKCGTLPSSDWSTARKISCDFKFHQKKEFETELNSFRQKFAFNVCSHCSSFVFWCSIKLSDVLCKFRIYVIIAHHWVSWFHARTAVGIMLSIRLANADQIIKLTAPKHRDSKKSESVVVRS